MKKKIALQMTPKLVNDIYGVLSLTPPTDRVIRKITITIEAGKPVGVTEDTFPITEIDVPDEVPGTTVVTPSGNA